MKRISKYLMLLIFGIAIHLTATAQTNKLKQFSFLLGNWEMSTPKGKITETWYQNKGSLNGKSYRHTLNGDSILLETLVIKKIDGFYTYCSTVKGQNDNMAVNFKLISDKDSTYIFENAAHDFPQQIVYQNRGKTMLLAWIEGKIKGKNRKSEFHYQRRH
ncbi:MAG: DUF6265 family protein [Bacteroidota bacterium]